jgi:ethanolamine utilization protein EutQ (cupin superfamily)
MCWWEKRGVDSRVVSNSNGVMFAPKNQTVKIAVGAQIGFLHTGVGCEERARG